MALTFVSILALAGAVAASPLPQVNPDGPIAQSTPASNVPCKFWYKSQPGDTCRSIGLPAGYYDTDILAANTFLNCDDIWEGTWICIPDIPYPATVTYPSTTVPLTISTTATTPATLPTPVCTQTYVTSSSDETCDSIGAKFGITGSDILSSNSFLNCNDIWLHTSICIPGISYPPSGCQATYYSAPGDTCDSIAGAWGIQASQIKAANDFLDCNNIWSGTPICMPYPATTTRPPPSGVTPAPTCRATYTSVANDNCDTIGQKYGITGTDIFNANTFLNCNDIWVNTPICIPAIIVVPVPTCMNNYISVQGDTCEIIGSKYHISGAQILSANSFLNCDDIWVGTPICVPWPIISDPFPTDEPITYDPDTNGPITWDPPTDPVTSTVTPTEHPPIAIPTEI